MKISYQKNWDKNGTCYDQKVTFNNSELLINMVNENIKLVLKTV